MKMSGQSCPNCGARLAKGSTFCIRCGTRLTPTAGPAEPILKEGPSTEPELSDDQTSTSSSTPSRQSPENVDSDSTSLDEAPSIESTPEASEKEELESAPPQSHSAFQVAEDSEDGSVPGFRRTEPPQVITDKEFQTPVRVVDAPTSVEMRDAVISWDEPSTSIEDMSLKMDEPPSAVAPEDTEVAKPEAPSSDKTVTIDAFKHLFPEGRGETSTDFIDRVVGTQERIRIKGPLAELETPTCPSCGAELTSDGFTYPPYVFEAMARARFEAGQEKMNDNEYESAIECFEKAKLLAERAKNKKLIDQCVNMIDKGYEGMASSHFALGEKHLKAHEFEWAIVQFKKARQLYMFTTQSKKRAKCSDKVRECFFVWGKTLEEEGDRLAKSGKSREALLKYQEAAEKYKESGDPRRLRGLEKKIRRA